MAALLSLSEGASEPNSGNLTVGSKTNMEEIYFGQNYVGAIHPEEVHLILVYF
jgi:hypothetical protein